MVKTELTLEELTPFLPEWLIELKKMLKARKPSDSRPLEAELDRLPEQ